MTESKSQRYAEIFGLEQASVAKSDEPSLNEFDNRANAIRTLQPDLREQITAVVELVELMPSDGMTDAQKALLGHALLDYVVENRD